jgi:8-oxo-dGTP pyrophosphatase MutT (NUDIX family)
MSAGEGKTKIPTLEQISAGGVAFRPQDNAFEVVIVSMNPSGRWQLPKGLIDDGETPEAAALREVREEAGVDTELLTLVDTIDYWFISDWDEVRRRIHKQVHFYLLRYSGGEVADHDDEVLDARWVTIDNAIEILAFESERDVLKKAAAMMANFS